EGRILVTVTDLSAPLSAGVDPLFEDGSALFTPRAIAVQSDGKILVAGYEEPASATSTVMFLSRYEADGTPDSSFGSGGKVVWDLDTAGPDQINDIGLVTDGRIVAVGKSGSSALAALFLTNGTLDTTFSTDGYHLVTPASGSAEFHGVSVGQRIRAVGTSAGDLLVGDL
ncbi:MAG: delta-60 repeat domain-containing protein, partial [Thermodesulfobacteriota bacterium]